MSQAMPFDAMAADYDKTFTSGAIGRRMRAAVSRRLDAAFSPGDRVLELNCGTGEDAVYLGSRGVRVLATDIAPRMLAATNAKIERAGLADVASVALLAVEDLPRLRADVFDGVFSNFGGLNCVEDLESAARGMAALVRPGGLVLLCVMGPVVPWEWGWFLARGQPGKAWRRLQRGGTPWRGLTIRYPSISDLRRVFAPHFTERRVAAIGALVPPSFAEPWAARHPRLLAALDRLERRAEATWPLPWLADHFLIELERTPDRMSMTRTGYAGIAETERRLDALLRNQVPSMQFIRTLRAARQEWSQAIWSSALSLGPSTLSAGELSRGLSLAQRPVFVCGAARSGTTMLRDLLDGHPELVVIPNESGFYTSMEPALMHLSSDRHLSFLACHWLERLVDPPPFWLLGRSKRDSSPYIAFARDFAGWWQVPERRKEARISSWPLAAFALAYAKRVSTGQLPPRARMWVEKTPGSERRLTRIWQDFPAAKVIQIVRRPEAVLASIKALTATRWTRRSTVAHILRNMATSYRIAAHNACRAHEDRFCLVRYEDLTTRPDTAMHRIAGFLGIEPLPSMLQPTTAGRPAFNNTSFRTSRPDPCQAIDLVDRTLLKLAVGRHAAELGYGPSEHSSAGAHSIVGGLV